MKDIKTGKDKKASEMTTRELARQLFPQGARVEIRRETSAKPKKSTLKVPSIKADPK